MGAHVQLRVYDDRLSIWNEGGLPFGLSVDELRRDHNSRPRNPKIAKACFMAGYIDAWGRGMIKIINACKEAGLPEPDIREKDGGFEVVIHKAAQNNDEGGQIGGVIEKASKEFGTIEDRIAEGKENNIQYLRSTYGVFSEYFRSNFGISSDEIHDNFGENYLFTLILIAIDKSVTAKNISDLIGVTDRTIENYLAKLQKNGLLKRTGSDKTGFWEILKQQ
jgi:ATP-dependent DNA helicase RecG